MKVLAGEREREREREREKELIHTEKQVERQRIYNKYQLSNCSKKIKGFYTSSQGAKDGSQVRPPQNAYRTVLEFQRL